MNREQFFKILVVLMSNYPSWKIDTSNEIVMEFWYESLKDIDYEVAQVGIQKLISTEEFYPNIAKIRKACASVTNQPSTDSTEAWGLVQRAIRHYGYMNGNEALASLPSDVAMAVKYMGGWTAICESENVEADRAHFYRCIDQIANRKEKESLLSLDLRQAIHNYQLISSASDRQEIEGKRKEVPLLELSIQEIEHGETESIGDILRRQLRTAN